MHIEQVVGIKPGHQRVKFKCPDGSMHEYRVHQKDARVSNSWDPEEAKLLAYVFRGLTHDRDISSAKRHKRFPQVASKMLKMKERSERKQLELRKSR